MRYPHFYIWLDDVRPFPFTDTPLWSIVHSVNEAKRLIESAEKYFPNVNDFILDLDHDLGDYAADGGDGYELVKWLIETERNNAHFEIRCHSANPVGRANIMQLVKRYW